MVTQEIYTIRTKAEFESAHAIRDYLPDPDNPGQYVDEDIHGHSWIVEVFVSSNQINKRTGFAIDFLTVKNKLESLAHQLDHKFINEVSPFDIINPSTENIAKWFYDEIITILPQDTWLDKVRVWEGPHNFAEYQRKD